jgi:hypothetical protein
VKSQTHYNRFCLASFQSQQLLNHLLDSWQITKHCTDVSTACFVISTSFFSLDTVTHCIQLTFKTFSDAMYDVRNLQKSIQSLTHKITGLMWDLRFISQKLWWRLQPSSMWCHVVAQIYQCYNETTFTVEDKGTSFTLKNGTYCLPNCIATHRPPPQEKHIILIC